MEKTIVLASGNEGKAREFRAILEPLGFKIVLQNWVLILLKKTVRAF